MYNSAPTIRQGVKANTDANVLKAKLALNCESLQSPIGSDPPSSADTPDGSPLGNNLL